MAKQIIEQQLTTTGFFSVREVRDHEIKALEDLDLYDFMTPRVTGHEPNSPNTIVIVLKKDQFSNKVLHFIHPVTNQVMKVSDVIRA